MHEGLHDDKRASIASHDAPKNRWGKNSCCVCRIMERPRVHAGRSIYGDQSGIH
jgi:hypothetical protein